MARMRKQKTLFWSCKYRLSDLPKGVHIYCAGTQCVGAIAGRQNPSNYFVKAFHLSRVAYLRSGHKCHGHILRAQYRVHNAYIFLFETFALSLAVRLLSGQLGSPGGLGKS
jgi:hypothetical protein